MKHRKSLTQETLYIIWSCYKRDNKMIFLSSPARAKGRATIRLCCYAKIQQTFCYVSARTDWEA